MYVQPQDAPFDIYQPLSSLATAGTSGGDVLGAPDAGALPGTVSNSSDAISRFVPPWANANAASSPQDGSQTSMLGILNNLIAQLAQMVQQLGGQFGFGQAGGTFGAGSFGGPCGSSQQFFQSASGGSTGDPHLSFDGQHWNDMQSQSSLIDSNSFEGGYNVSTQTTAPNGRGVTFNQSASVTTGYGSTAVTLDNQGNATVSENGQQFTLGDGQSMSLGNGESVSRSNDGAVTVTDTNQWGGTINTTLTDAGRGVNVSVQANNVDLGGSLVNGPAPQPAPAPAQPAAPQPAPPFAPGPSSPIVPGEPWRRYVEPGAFPN
ncbi:MAG: hypothetical protein ACLQPV_09910 [Vulcanimicrobiaceae bacterium]